MPDVFFNFADLTSTFLSEDVTPKVRLVPYYSPLVFSGSIITADFVEQDLNVTSSATFTNIVPNVYHVEVWTKKIETAFDLFITSELTGSINGADYIITNFTGSDAAAFRLVPVPETTASFGRQGWIALSSDFIYVYDATLSLWVRTAVSLW